MVLLSWRRLVATGCVLSSLYLLLPGAGARESVWLLTLAVACVAVAEGIRRHRPSNTRPWWILCVGFGFMLLANVLRLPVWVTPGMQRAGEVGLLVAYGAFGIAALALVRAQAPHGDREGAIDSTMVMIALATVLSGTVFAPEAAADAQTPFARLLLLGPPLVVAGVIAATLRLVFVGSSRVVSTWLIVGAGLAGLTGNVLRTLLSAAGSYERGTWPDLFLFVAPLCVAVAALHPSMTRLTEPALAGERPLTYARLAVLAAALLAAPGTLLLPGPGSGPYVPAIASLALSLLVLWRLGALVVEREAVRIALHARAARQEALARIGRHALGDGDLDSLFAEATSIAAELLELDGCKVVAGRPTPWQLRGTLALPLGDAHHTYGVLLASGRDRWSAEDRAFLQSVANVLSGAVERDRTQRLMRHQALHDPLTGLPNRLRLRERLASALQASAADGSTVAVLFVDLDGFKGVNDQLGHQAGDEVLVAVARRLRNAVRPCDLLARLAGDEFVIVCQHIDRAEALAIAERAVAALSDPFAVPGGQVQLGASMGVALSGSSRDVDRLMSDADEAMYRAKTRAGSSVEVFDDCPRQRAGAREGSEAGSTSRLGLPGRPAVRSGVASQPLEES